MKFLTVCVSTLAFALPMAAQAPQSQPTQNADPEAAEPTVEERIATLKAEIEKRKAELARLKEIETGGGLGNRVKSSLNDRTIAPKSIEDKNKPEVAAAPARPEAPARKKARLFGDDEKGQLAANVIMTVNGVAATQDELDAAVQYMKSYPQRATDDDLKQRAMMELIRVKAPQAEFKDSAAKALKRIQEIQKELNDGADFAAVAKTSSQCPSSARGGDLDYFGRVGMDFWFTKGAFGLEVDETSGIIASSFGYHLIKCTGKQDGETDDRDRIRASHILQMYTPNQQRLAQVSQAINMGQLDLAFASQELLALAPPAYQ